VIYLGLFVWNKPVLTLFRDRRQQYETEPFAVVQAKKLSVTTSEKKAVEGNIEDFFALKGNLCYISFKGGESDRYIICWFDNEVDDFRQASRQLGGVTFPPSMPFTVDEKGKKTYNTTLKAEYGKLE
jgi:hypothetical protein